MCKVSLNLVALTIANEAKNQPHPNKHQNTYNTYKYSM